MGKVVKKVRINYAENKKRREANGEKSECRVSVVKKTGLWSQLKGYRFCPASNYVCSETFFFYIKKYFNQKIDAIFASMAAKIAAIEKGNRTICFCKKVYKIFFATTKTCQRFL